MRLLNLLFWKFKFWVNGFKFYPIGGGGGGDDEAPSLPARQTPEQQFTTSPRLQELDQMIRAYIGKSLNAPSEWGQQGDVLNRLLNYQPQLTYLQEPGEYGQLSGELNKLLGTTPEQFAYPMADIQKALEAQQAIQLQQYQNQIRPVLANQGQLDSTYYANLLGDFLKNQQAQTYGTTANLLTNQATQNFDLAKWLPQFKANIGSQIGNLGTARLGVQQSNANLANQLAQWLPNWQASIAGQIGNLGSNKLNLQQQNLMLPLSTYIPGLSSLYGTATGLADTNYQDALKQYQVDMQNWENEQANRGGMLGSLGTLGGMGLGALFAAPTGGMSMLAGAQLGGALGGTGSTFFGGTPSSGINLGNALTSAFPQENTMDKYLKYLMGGGTSIPQADVSSIYNTNFKLPSMASYFNQNYSGYA